ncbi:hypothetical protein BC936DRAFT_137914 [Jimgerdemannia flammicorona]|uniref:Uncharacterized protein n=1 Tax=Jimgerdemannia flammicorona TaxID=994334 RepID=A0A433CWF9_9FUNG|nr:hypothetical protein BC936DRAFT_137914 [Jimgerdemannia flammicorona]
MSTRYRLQNISLHNYIAQICAPEFEAAFQVRQMDSVWLPKVSERKVNARARLDEPSSGRLDGTWERKAAEVEVREVLRK